MNKNKAFLTSGVSFWVLVTVAWKVTDYMWACLLSCVFKILLCLLIGTHWRCLLLLLPSFWLCQVQSSSLLPLTSLTDLSVLSPLLFTLVLQGGAWRRVLLPQLIVSKHPHLCPQSYTSLKTWYSPNPIKSYWRLASQCMGFTFMDATNPELKRMENISSELNLFSLINRAHRLLPSFYIWLSLVTRDDVKYVKNMCHAHTHSDIRCLVSKSGWLLFVSHTAKYSLV